MIQYFKKQLDFLQSQTKEVVMLAAMGVGKTFILGEYVAHYLQDNLEVDHPTKPGQGVYMLVVCSTVATMNDTIIAAIEESLDRYGMEYHRTINSKKIIVTQYRADGTPVKNVIYLRTSEKRSEIRGFRVHATVMEEALICHEDCWLKMKQRTNLGKNPVIRIISSFPYTKSNHLYKMYGPQIKRDSLKVITPTLFDNCYRDNALELMKDQIFNTYFMRLAVPEKQLDKLIKMYWEYALFDDVKAKKILAEIKDCFLPESISPEAYAEVFSQWVDGGSSLAYRSAKRDVHLKKLEGFPRKEYGQVWIGMDFNRTPYTVVLAQYVNSDLKIFKEYQLPDKDSEMVSEFLYDMLKDWGFDDPKWHGVVSDSTGGNKSTKPFTDWDYIQQAGLNLQLTFNPFWKNRINNVNRWFKANRIIIDPEECPTLVEELEIATMQEMEERREGKLYHASVVLGYLCWFIEPDEDSSRPNTRVI